MQTIDVFLTFGGIDAPTVKMTGNDACALTLRPLVNGREEGEGSTLFAYPDDIFWKAVLVNVEPGQYRLSLLNNSHHCFEDILIDDRAVAERALHVEFNWSDCRRRRVPALLKRIWWSIGEFVEKRREHPRRDRRVLSRYRRRFRRGPVGLWLSEHDRQSLYGTAFLFREDATGSVRSWGHEDGADVEQEFRWTSVGDFKIDIQPVAETTYPEDWGVVEYGFRVARGPYGDRLVLMCSTNQPAIEGREPGFWQSMHPVALAKQRDP